MSNLPSPAESLQRAREHLRRAYAALGDAGDELRSDWPEGTELTPHEITARSAMFSAITRAKAAINEGL